MLIDFLDLPGILVFIYHKIGIRALVYAYGYNSYNDTL